MHFEFNQSQFRKTCCLPFIYICIFPHHSFSKHAYNNNNTTTLHLHKFTFTYNKKKKTFNTYIFISFDLYFDECVPSVHTYYAYHSPFTYLQYLVLLSDVKHRARIVDVIFSCDRFKHSIFVTTTITTINTHNIIIF